MTKTNIKKAYTYLFPCILDTKTMHFLRDIFTLQ